MKKIRKRKKKKIERNHRDPSPIQFLTTPNHASLSVHEKLFNWTFFPLFLPPTYEWPRPTVLKNWWVFFGELQFYIIWYMSPTCILCFFWAFYWLWHNLTRLPGKYASTTCTPKSRQSLDASSWREIAGAIGTGRNMTNQNEDVILFRPPQTTIQSHIHTQVTHKNTTPHHISLYFNLPEHLQTR